MRRAKNTAVKRRVKPCAVRTHASSGAQPYGYLLCEVFEWDLASPWDALVDNPAQVFLIAFTQRKSYDRADDDATNATDGDAFE